MKWQMSCAARSDPPGSLEENRMRYSLVVAILLLPVLGMRANLQQHDHGAAAEEHADVQHHAVNAMSGMGGHHHDPHMKMTARRPLTRDDARRADALVQRLRQTLDRYKDYQTAIRDGYKPFLAELPLPQYHFTNYWYGFLGAFTFDPAKPTSLLYRKRGRGYELLGAMYTAPKSFSEAAARRAGSAQRRQLACTRQHLPALPRQGTSRLVAIRIPRIDRVGADLPGSRWPMVSPVIRVDGARVSLRDHAGTDLAALRERERAEVFARHEERYADARSYPGIEPPRALVRRDRHVEQAGIPRGQTERRDP